MDEFHREGQLVHSEHLQTLQMGASDIRESKASKHAVV